MIAASKLYKISKEQKPQIVDEVLKGVEEHIAERCVQEANKGNTSYSIYLKSTYKYAEDLLFERCIKLVKEFEDYGYKISIDDAGDDMKVEYILTFSWDGNVIIKESRRFGRNYHLYDTNSGIITDNKIE